MVKHLRVGGVTVVVVCVLALMAGWSATALGAAGTTMLPAEAILSATLAERTTAVFELPLGTVTCSSSSATGAVAEEPGNAYEQEEEEAEREETLELPGSVAATFGRPTFSGCSFPGASSVTVTNTVEEAWPASAMSDAEVDIFGIGIPDESLSISIATASGTCTIVAPTVPAVAVGGWTNGSEGGGSTVELEAQLDYSASGTCFINCARLAAAGSIPTRLTYSITNAAEEGESITF